MYCTKRFRRSLTTHNSFCKQKYVGKWFENRKYVSDYEVGQRCVSVEFRSNRDGEMIVENTGTQKM